MKIFLGLIFFVYIAAACCGGAGVYDAFVACLSDNNVFQEKISAIVYGPNNPSFENVLDSGVRNLRFNLTTTRKPSIIVAPTAETEVSAAVVCSKKVGLQIKIRSGGHDYEGISYVSDNEFMILDMFNFRSIDIDMTDATVWVGVGAYLGELYYRIWEKSKVHAFPGGVCPTVGVGGHISGAGYGNLLRKHGLTVDHVIDARIVDANGRILDRRGMGGGSFWAIRGGGGASFAVILSYRIKLVPVPATVTVFRLRRFYDDDAAEVVFQYQQAVTTIDENLFIRVLLQPVIVNKKKVLRATFIGEFLGGADQLISVTTARFPKLGLQKSDCQEMPWINSVLFWAKYDNKTSPTILLSRKPNRVKYLKRKSDYVKTPISISGLKTIFNKMVEIGKVGLVFNSYGGVMDQMSDSETPFPHRKGTLYKIQYSVTWNEEGEETAQHYINNTRILYNFMTPFVSSNPREAYLNYRDLDIGTSDNTYNGGRVYGLKYFKNNFDRLVQIKTKVDPENVFRNEQSIPLSVLIMKLLHSP